MEMRDADLVETRREGRYIFYRLTEPQLLDLIFDIGSLFGIPSEKMESLRKTNPLSECCCPDCTAHRNPTVLSKGEIQSLLKEK
jgi:hypothetical protein